jgi:hypothetical protein
MRVKALNLRFMPVELIQRAKAVAAFRGMTLTAFVIECITQAVERDWATLLKEIPHLVVNRTDDGQALGWKCSADGCVWEANLPPGPIVEEVKQQFINDAKASFARHLENCPGQRDRAAA